MLFLDQRPNQTIRIGPDIVIRVVEIERGKVRLGIEAPRELSVVREEIESLPVVAVDEQAPKPHNDA